MPNAIEVSSSNEAGMEELAQDLLGLLGVLFVEREPGRWEALTKAGSHYSIQATTEGFRISWQFDPKNELFEAERRSCGYHDTVAEYLEDQLRRLGWQVRS
jgi:hypothetical protein